MKKLVLFFVLALCAAGVRAQEGPETGTGAECNLPKEAAVVPSHKQTVKAVKLTPAQKAEAAEDPVLTQEEQYERFKARNKEIRKLTKQYRKAKSEDEKTQIKARLSQIVSEVTDEGIAWSKARIAAERANLDQWEKILREQEASLEQVKAKRVDDILSGEAERRHKLAQKRWKQEMKDRKKYMN